MFLKHQKVTLNKEMSALDIQILRLNY